MGVDVYGSCVSMGVFCGGCVIRYLDLSGNTISSIPSNLWSLNLLEYVVLDVVCVVCGCEV